MLTLPDVADVEALLGTITGCFGSSNEPHDSKDLVRRKGNN